MTKEQLIEKLKEITRPITKENVDLIIQLLDSGEKVSHLAKIIDVNNSTIYIWIKKFYPEQKIDWANQKITKEKAKKICDYYVNTDLRIEEIAKICDVHLMTIHRVVKKYNIPVKKRFRKPRQKKV